MMDKRVTNRDRSGLKVFKAELGYIPCFEYVTDHYFDIFQKERAWRALGTPQIWLLWKSGKKKSIRRLIAFCHKHKYETWPGANGPCLHAECHMWWKPNTAPSTWTHHCQGDTWWWQHQFNSPSSCMSQHTAKLEQSRSLFSMNV